MKNKFLTFIACLCFSVWAASAQYFPTVASLTSNQIDEDPAQTNLWQHFLHGTWDINPPWSPTMRMQFERKNGQDAAWQMLAEYNPNIFPTFPVTVGDGDLSKTIRYYYRIRLVDGLAWLYSNEQAVQFDSTADTNRPTITTLPIASSITTNSATITWGVGEANLTNTVEYWTGSATHSTVAASSSTIPTASLTGLLPGIGYSYIVRSLDQAGNYSQASSNFSTTASSSQMAKQFGSKGNDTSKAVAVDAAGNIYIAGYLTIPSATLAEFDGTTVARKGVIDMFIAKYNSALVLQWVRTFGGSGAIVNPHKIAVDASGKINIVGVFSGTADFGLGNRTSAGTAHNDIFLAQYNSDGTTLNWIKQFGNANTENLNEESVNAMAVNSATGDILIAGIFSYTVDFSEGTAAPLTGFITGQSDSFVAKYSSAGVHAWSKNWSNQGDDAITALIVDVSGNVFLGGSISSGAVNFGGGAIQNTNSNPAGTPLAMFLVKLSGAGAHLYSKGYNDAEVKTLALTTDGNYIVVAGSFSGSVNVGGSTFTNPGSSSDKSIFLAKYDLTLNHQWSEGIGGLGLENVSQVAVDPSGNIVLFGNFSFQTCLYPIQGGAVGGPTINVAPGSEFLSFDLFLAKYSSSGAHTWSSGYGGISEESPFGMAVGAGGNIICAGRFRSVSSIVGTSLTSLGGSDGFVFRRAP